MEFVHNIIANNTKLNVAWLEFIGYTNSGVDPEGNDFERPLLL